MQTDVIIIGAGASGLLCAIEAGKRGRKVIVLDHANKAGKKILMSGGGRCNFTNTEISADNFISNNYNFCKSALSHYTQWDFIAQVNQYAIKYHERDLGKLFCDDSAKDILNMLLAECEKVGVKILLNSTLTQLKKNNSTFEVETTNQSFTSTSCVIATGGLSIPKMSASPFGYKIAQQFGHRIINTRAGLVAFTLHDKDKQQFSTLAGISVFSEVSNAQISFKENILFTHRGLSGPAILQISSYWKTGETITINLLPDINLYAQLILQQKQNAKQLLKTVLAKLVGKQLAKRLINTFFSAQLLAKPLQEISQVKLKKIADTLQNWQLKPNATEGYRTAEVTLGGVDCNELFSKTLASRKVSGLFFIGEVVDVTGWLGGYNFQWAWSSGWCAGQVV